MSDMLAAAALGTIEGVRGRDPMKPHIAKVPLDNVIYAWQEGKQIGTVNIVRGDCFTHWWACWALGKIGRGWTKESAYARWFEQLSWWQQTLIRLKR